MTSDQSTLTPQTLRELAAEGTEFAQWFTIQAEIQEAVNQVNEDAAEGLSCLEQATTLRQRLAVLTDRLQTEAMRIKDEYCC